MRSTAPPPSAVLPQEEVVIQIPLSALYSFPNHPFRVRDDEAMRGMLESVREYGVLRIPEIRALGKRPRRPVKFFQT